MTKTFIPLLLLLLLAGCSATEERHDLEVPAKLAVEANPTASYLTPEESMKKFNLPPGYRLELVADESILNEPVAIAWDGNGKMYVAEMRTYMQDVDGNGTREPRGRISLLEDTDGDGKIDRHSIFIDSLVLPRMILPLDDRLLVNETYTYDLWSYKDTNHDGVADEKKLEYHSDEVDNRNLEHQASGLLWNLDNWIYVARNPLRFQFTEKGIRADTILDGPQGQWGLTSDDYGRLFFSSAGGEVPANGFQMNPVYGAAEMENELADDFESVWPILATPDVQGGYHRLRPDSTLNHFTASCGQAVFQGDGLPEDLRGDLLICEPVGRLIRRAEVINQEGQTILKNVYHQQEFIASTDMNFRPVNLATGPDGCLYIVDMYRGIIQESNWTREGSFIRPVIKRKKLDENFGRGRIYRLVHDGYTPGSSPHMLTETPKEWVHYLSHPNAWWRTTAQKLIILKGDKSVVPDLEEMTSDNRSWIGKLFGAEENPLTRTHALWTLKGLGELRKEVLLPAFKDENAQVRKTAVWASEDLIRSNDADVLTALEELKNDSSHDVRIQLALSLRYNATDRAKKIIREIKDNDPDNKLLQLAATGSLSVNSEPDYIKRIRPGIAEKSPDTRELIIKGATIFKQLCATCHGADGKGVLGKSTNKLLAPPLDGSPRLAANKEVVTRIVLHGLTGPVDGKTYPDVMVAMESNDDEWISSVLCYARFAFANDASAIKPHEVKRIRDKEAGRKKYWTLKELEQLKIGN